MNRSTTRIVVLAAAMLVGAAGRVYGDTIVFSTLGPNDAFESRGASFTFSSPSPPLASEFRFAMQFQVPSDQDLLFSAAILPLASTGDIASVEIQLLSSSEGNPILESILVTSQVLSTPALITAMSRAFPVLEAGDTYFLAVDVRPQLTTSSRWGMSTHPGDPRGPNVEVRSAVDAFPLTPGGPSPVGFTIRAVEVPGPSTLVIVATGVFLTLGRPRLKTSRDLRAG